MEDFFEEGRKACSPQGVMLDFMTVIVGVMQVTVSIGVAIKADKNDNNNNNNNNNDNNNNNNININDDNINFVMMGMQNMMMMGGRGLYFMRKQAAYCTGYFLCTLHQRRYELNNQDEIGLKTLK